MQPLRLTPQDRNPFDGGDNWRKKKKQIKIKSDHVYTNRNVIYRISKPNNTSKLPQKQKPSLNQRIKYLFKLPLISGLKSTCLTSPSGPPTLSRYTFNSSASKHLDHDRPWRGRWMVMEGPCSPSRKWFFVSQNTISGNSEHGPSMRSLPK